MRDAAPIVKFLAEPLSKELKLALEHLSQAPDVRRIAVMPDVHLATNVCNGTVLATSQLVYPQAVGSDIGCGMLAAAFDCSAADIDCSARGQGILHAIGRAIPVIRHRAHRGANLNVSGLSDDRLAKQVSREAGIELGTLGRGNHFVELQRDDLGQLWLMIHSGSRAAGQVISAWHLRRAQAARHKLLFLDARDERGKAYINDCLWAEGFAARNRLKMLEAVVLVISASCGGKLLADSLINCSHNHVRTEVHGGEALVIHRKGANSAAANEAGIIPGSMGSESHHVIGKGYPDALRSSSHGAGRKMSRTEAAQRISRRDLTRQMEGCVFNQDLADKLKEEAPGAYKDIRKVMEAQRDLVQIHRKLWPILTFKGV